MAITYNGSGAGGAIVPGVDQWTPVQGGQVHNDLVSLDTSRTDHETRIDTLESSSGGDVDGPASSTDNEIPRFNGTSGKLLQTSGITIADGASGTLAGSNSGDVTLSGTPDYITISAQVITVGLVDLAADVTGDLPLANLAQAPAASRLLGRGAGAGAGDWEALSIGAGLLISGTTLVATGSVSIALDDISDVVITTPSTDQILKYNGTNWVNTTISTNSIAANAVTNAKLATMVQSTIKGRAAGAGTGDPTDLSATQATAILDNFVGDSGSGGTKGLVPAPATGDAAANKFLKANGSWVAVTTPTIKRALTFVFDGGGSVITTGQKGVVRIPCNGTITKWTMVSSDASITSGSITVDLWYDSYANYPPTNADSIVASSKPAISSAIKNEDSTLSGWTTSLTEGGFMIAEIESVISFTHVTLFVELTQS